MQPNNSSEHSGFIVARREDLRVIRCASCRYAHLDPLPDETNLRRFYASSFWQNEKPDGLTRMEEQKDWWNAIYGDWLDTVEAFIEPGRLLDIGCGYGHFLAIASDRGWDCIGAEPNKAAADYAASRIGLQIRQETWQDALSAVPGSTFTAISALWLMEHLSDPGRFTVRAWNALMPGGIFLAIVPSELTELQRAGEEAVDNPGFWIHHTHINYFTWGSFEWLLERNGFEIVGRMATYPMETFLVAGHDYTRGSALGRECHKQVETFELSIPATLRQSYARSLALRGEGRDIVLVARKP